MRQTSVLNRAIAHNYRICRTGRITGWQWSAAKLPVRVDAVVRHLILVVSCDAGYYQACPVPFFPSPPGLMLTPPPWNYA